MTQTMENTGAAEDILRYVRNQLYMSMPYLGSALFALEYRPEQKLTLTAATDGQGLYCSEDYLSGLFLRGDVRCCRLVLHMLLHCLLRHPGKHRDREGLLWDLACDAAVESIIDSLPYPCTTLPPTAVRRRFFGECLAEMKAITAEAVYRKLLRDRPPEYELVRLQRELVSDDHGLWDMSSREDAESADKQWKNLAAKVQSALERNSSTEAEGGETVLEQVRISAADSVDYRAFLRRFAAPREVMHCDDDAFDYIYYTFGLNRYGNVPLIEPPETREEKRIEELVIAVDTSMSTSGELVREFLKCTCSVLLSTGTFTRRLNIHILQCDNEVRSDTVIRDLSELRELMENFSLRGGSATDFRPVFAYTDSLMKQGLLPNLKGLIYFTDGMGIYPSRRPVYDTAFVMPELPPAVFQMPPWIIKIPLGVTELEKVYGETELGEEERLAEMPEL